MKKEKKKLKNIFGVLALSLLLTVSLAPTAVFADEPANGNDAADRTEEPAAKQIEEPKVDEKTTAPNHIDTAVPSDEKEGTDISCKAKMTIWGMEWTVADKSAAITAKDAKEGKTLGDVSEDFKGTELEDYKAGQLVMKGNLSIQNQDGSASDTTNKAAHDVKKNTKYDIKAELDVSAVHNAIEESAEMLGSSDTAKAMYVNNLETGLRSTFTFGSDLNGEYYVPISLEDAQKHYVLSSADSSPLIYRINYAKSKFTKDKVVIVMDLDLTQMGPQKTTYDGSGKMLYGTDADSIMENFNHEEKAYGDTYDTSTFGNLKQLITSSAKKISLLIKDVLLHSADGNRKTTETSTAVTTTTQGTINGTLVGYMKANVGHNRTKGNVSYIWGAMQDPAGKDVNKDDDDDSISLTTQFTETIKKDNPDQPDKPDNPNQPDKPDQPDRPVNPDQPDRPDHPSNPSKPGNATMHQKTNQTTRDVTVNKTAASPKTGDTDSFSIWLVLMMISAGVCGTSVIYRRKQNGR